MSLKQPREQEPVTELGMKVYVQAELRGTS